MVDWMEGWMDEGREKQVSERMQTETCVYGWWERKVIYHQSHQSGGSSESYTESPNDSVTLLLGIFPKQWRTGYNTSEYVFLPALFTVAKIRKQPKCPLREEWVNCSLYVE